MFDIQPLNRFVNKCPKCGAEESACERLPIFNETEHIYYVQCQSCGFEGPNCSSFLETVKAWNQAEAKQPAPLLSPDEYAVLNTLAGAWNLFIKLPVLHPCDRDEFMRAIHAAQALVQARPAMKEEWGDERLKTCEECGTPGVWCTCGEKE